MEYEGKMGSHVFHLIYQQMTYNVNLYWSEMIRRLVIKLPFSDKAP
jgi:hypothetical protein